MVVNLDDRKSTGDIQQEKEAYNDVRYLLRDAVERLGAFPEVDEPKYEEGDNPPPRRLGDEERKLVWAMTSLFGIVATYAMIIGDRPLLTTLLIVAMLLILRLLGRSTKR